MGTLTLRYPVHTLDNRQLLSVGTELSLETLEALCSTRPLALSPSSNLLDYGSVRDDILHFFSQAPYHVIFGDKKRTAKVFGLMEGVHLILPTLEILDHFKKHDSYTYRHILMVFALSTLLAQDLVKDRQDLVQEAISGPMHDMGKICTPLEILKKTTPLTLNERDHLEHHTLAGHVLLSYYLNDAEILAASVARDHHERRDGSGYPVGIRLTDPLVEIVAASDIYDALISPRPYRRTSYDNRTALEEITALAERGEMSWGVIQGLVAYNRKGRPHYSEVSVSSEKRGTPPTDSVYGIIAKGDNGPTET